MVVGVCALFSVFVAFAQIVPFSLAQGGCQVNELNVAASGQTGLFLSAGPMNPHAYRPNEFITNNSVYEGLVAWENGAVVPSLATSWEVRDVSGTNATEVVFNLRRKVSFSDGAPWNSEACRLNFENAMHPVLRDPRNGIHDWYELPRRIESWSAPDEWTFVLRLAGSYSQAVQELTYIRPMRFVSPLSIYQDSPLDNTCPPSWGNFSGALRCRGIKSPVGTGPWILLRQAENVTTFVPNSKYWGLTPAVKLLNMHRYDDRKVVYQDLLKGKIDVALSALHSDDLKSASNTEQFSVQFSGPLNTRLLAFNTQRFPTDDIRVRQAVIHAIDKEKMVATSLLGQETVAMRIFHESLPFCNVNLSPAPGYDADKVRLLLDSAGWVLNTSVTPAIRYKNGLPLRLDFPYVEDTSGFEDIQDDIERDLLAFGIMADSQSLSKDAYNERVSTGDFSAVLTESWGPPYDPHAFTASWRSLNEADGAAQRGMQSPSKAAFDQLISSAFYASSSSAQQIWTEILTAIHNNSVYLPLTYARNHAVARTSVKNLTLGFQQFDFPLNQIYCEQYPRSAATSSGVTLSPGAIAGITIGVIVFLAAVVTIVAFVVYKKAYKWGSDNAYKTLSERTDKSIIIPI